jgi:alkylmercury lyase
MEVTKMSRQNLTNYDLQELADKLMAVVGESFMGHLLRTQKLLLEGSPLSPERIAEELQPSQDEVSTILRMAELDQDGNLVGLGLSLVPTPHSYQIDGRQLYTWCAADAIVFPIFLKTSAIIESPDPISGEKVRLMGTPEGARGVEPSTAVVSWVPGTESLENIRSWFCNFTNFFTSVETASQYVSQHPGLVIVPVDQVFQLGKLLWEREPYKSIIADL